MSRSKTDIRVRPSAGKRIRKSLPYYGLILLPLIYLLLFKYYPMLGIQIAFKKYKAKLGIWGSPWIGFKYFNDFFSSATAGTIIWNTFSLSLYYLVASFPFPIILAIALNECRSRRFQKVTQMVTYMPYFISTVVLVSMILQFTDISNGFVNQIIRRLGGKPINFMGTVGYFRSLYVWTGVWQSMGYSAIVYLAALSGVDLQLYEAARVEGANKWQQTRYITLPSIVPTIVLLLTLSMPGLIQAGTDQIYPLMNTANMGVAEVIDIYVLRNGLQQGYYGMSTALGLVSSVLSLLLVLGTNKIANLLNGEGLW